MLFIIILLSIPFICRYIFLYIFDSFNTFESHKNDVYITKNYYDNRQVHLHQSTNNKPEASPFIDNGVPFGS